jgi:hypothetical protein
MAKLELDADSKAFLDMLKALGRPPPEGRGSGEGAAP